MSNVTIKSTKDQIFGAYQEALAKVKELKEGKTSVAEVVKAKEIKQVKEKAKEIIELDILNEAMKEKYSALLKTLELLQGEIEELYGIKKEADTLETLINAYKDKNRELEELYKEKAIAIKKQHDVEIETLLEAKNRMIDENIRLKDELADGYKDEKEKLQKERARENEEYKYSLERNKRLDLEEWEESKVKRFKLLEEEINTKQNELIAREDHVKERETIVDTKDIEVQKLKEKIIEIELVRENDITEATKNGRAEAGKEFGFQKSMIEREAKWEKERLNDKIASLEKELATEKEAHKVALNKLDIAYAQIQEIATKTVMSNNTTRIVEKSN